MPEIIDHCATCGMLAREPAEFHPNALCLLVKARDGDTTKARSDLAFVLRAGRTNEPATRRNVDQFIASVAEESRA